MSVIDPQSLARALGGEASGNEIRCPGPGHSPSDRGLSVKLDPRASDARLRNQISSESVFQPIPKPAVNDLPILVANRTKIEKVGLFIL
jgi:hypothetical protein